MSDEFGHNLLATLAADIRAAHSGVRAAGIARARHALAAGRALIEAKSLLKHGRWLPWLKDQCGLPERTAQLYMKLAKLDVLPELDLMPNLIVALGMEAAAQSEAPIIMGTAPDYLAAYSEPIQRDWSLFALFIGSYDHTVWVMRQGYETPDEWLADDKLRRRWDFKNPSMSEGFKAEWAAYREQHAHLSRPSIEAKLKEREARAAA